MNLTNEEQLMLDKINEQCNSVEDRMIMVVDLEGSEDGMKVLSNGESIVTCKDVAEALSIIVKRNELNKAMGQRLTKVLSIK